MGVEKEVGRDVVKVPSSGPSGWGDPDASACAAPRRYSREVLTNPLTNRAQRGKIHFDGLVKT
jgi:hypothetical protein